MNQYKTNISYKHHQDNNVVFRDRCCQKCTSDMIECSTRISHGNTKGGGPSERNGHRSDVHTSDGILLQDRFCIGIKSIPRNSSTNLLRYIIGERGNTRVMYSVIATNNPGNVTMTLYYKNNISDSKILLHSERFFVVGTDLILVSLDKEPYYII